MALLLLGSWRRSFLGSAAHSDTHASAHREGAVVLANAFHRATGRTSKTIALGAGAAFLALGIFRCFGVEALHGNVTGTKGGKYQIVQPRGPPLIV